MIPQPHTSVNSAPAPAPALLGRHLAEIIAAGLDAETIRACGFRTITNAFKAMAAINQPLHRTTFTRRSVSVNLAGIVPALIVPYFDITGKRIAYARLRPHRSWRGRWYGPPQPVFTHNRLYMPPFPALHAALADPGKRLMIAPGELNTIAANAAGFPCVGLSHPTCDCWGWARVRHVNPNTFEPIGHRELIDDLAAIPWRGRPAYIVFDVGGDPDVQADTERAEQELAVALRRHGAITHVVRLHSDLGGQPS